jgi:ribosomal protein S18 acetylase RimI-like enzyme
MSGFTERAVTAADVPWIVALHAVAHARAFMNVPAETDVLAALGRANAADRVVLDERGERAALWRVSLEATWVAELRTLVSVAPGTGAGTWALRRALAWAFEERGVHRVFLYVTAANARARALYERHGLLLEGIERDGFRGPAGTFEGLCHYGMLEDEYATRRW